MRRARSPRARVESARRSGAGREGAGVLALSPVTENLLIVVPPDPSASREIGPGTVVAGLTLVRRIALAGARAGFQRVLVQPGCLDGVGLFGTPADVLTPPTSSNGARRRLVIIPVNVVPQSAWLRGLLDIPLEAETLHVDPSAIAMIETGDAERLLDEAARCQSAGGFLAAMRGKFPTVRRAFETSGRFPIARADDVARAESWLLRSLIKQNEGFMSRHVERRISLALTRRLVNTPITPNAMTLVSVALGLLGASFFLSSWPAWQFPGALLFLTHSILDGCDGEIARLKFLESRTGAALDFWGDNLVHVAVLTCMAIGWSSASGAVWPLALGALAVAGTLGAATAMSRKIMHDEGTGPGASIRARITDRLAHRDFIYVVAALSVWGKAWWFLPLVSFGAPLFLLLLLAPKRRRRG